MLFHGSPSVPLDSFGFPGTEPEKSLFVIKKKRCIWGNERLKSFGDLGDGPGKTTTKAAEAVAGVVEVAKGRPQVAGQAVPATPAQNTVGAWI